MPVGCWAVALALPFNCANSRSDYLSVLLSRFLPRQWFWWLSPPVDCSSPTSTEAEQQSWLAGGG